MHNPLYTKLIATGTTAEIPTADEILKIRAILNETTSGYKALPRPSSLRPAEFEFFPGYRAKVADAFKQLADLGFLGTDMDGKHVMRVLTPYKSAVPGECIYVGAGHYKNPMLTASVDAVSDLVISKMLSINAYNLYQALADYCHFDSSMRKWKKAEKIEVDSGRPMITVVAQEVDQYVFFLDCESLKADRLFRRPEVVIALDKDTDSWTKDQLRQAVDLIDLVYDNMSRDLLKDYSLDSYRVTFHAVNRKYKDAQQYCHDPLQQHQFFAATLEL